MVLLAENFRYGSISLLDSDAHSRWIRPDNTLSESTGKCATESGNKGLMMEGTLNWGAFQQTADVCLRCSAPSHRFAWPTLGEIGDGSWEMVTLRTPDLLPSTWCPNETRRGDGALSSCCVGSGTTTALGFGVGSHPAPPWAQQMIKTKQNLHPRNLALSG